MLPQLARTAVPQRRRPDPDRRRQLGADRAAAHRWCLLREGLARPRGSSWRAMPVAAGPPLADPAAAAPRARRWRSASRPAPAGADRRQRDVMRARSRSDWPPASTCWYSAIPGADAADCCAPSHPVRCRELAGRPSSGSSIRAAASASPSAHRSRRAMSTDENRGTRRTSWWPPAGGRRRSMSCSSTISISSPARNAERTFAALTELLPFAADVGLSVVIARRVSGSSRAAFEPFLGGCSSSATPPSCFPGTRPRGR